MDNKHLLNKTINRLVDAILMYKRSFKILEKKCKNTKKSFDELRNAIEIMQTLKNSEILPEAINCAKDFFFMEFYQKELINDYNIPKKNVEKFCNMIFSEKYQTKTNPFL